MKLTTFSLANHLISNMRDYVKEHSSLSTNPIDIALSFPEIIRFRFHLFLSGESTESLDGNKINLAYLEKDFKRSDLSIRIEPNFTMPIGYVLSENVFVIWDAIANSDIGVYAKLSVDTQSVIAVHFSKYHVRDVKYGDRKEAVMTAKPTYIYQAIKNCYELTIRGFARGI